jgi:hypothetical protein
MKWSKLAGDSWICEVPVALLTLKIQPKPDGRWAWQIFSGKTANAVASGIASSLGAAKTVTEQYVKRSGLV